MANTGRGRVKRPDDKRLKKNLPAERRAAVKPKSRLEMLIDGDITVEDLDAEELQKRRPRNRQGNFNGRPPTMLPRSLLLAMDVEFKKRIQTRFDELADDAIKALESVMKDQRAQAQARVNAAGMMLERVVGKVPDQLVQEVLVREFEDFKGVLIEVDDDSVDELAMKRQGKSA